MICKSALYPGAAPLSCAIALLITTMIVTLAALSICSCVALIKKHPQQGIYTTRPNAGLIDLMDEMFAGMTLEEA
ncbi:exonuclease V subunit beta [Escherichia coli]|uniref:Exonuclease V subunit beta n=1 Tax=Escherichia coli TaxID=562 RepID=A0A376MH64_ECOLX|nr:exonuclease V subunit beta [Escherichia coli]